MNYYKPDDRWEIFGIKTKEQFEQRFIVKGYFHDGVPNEIKDAFITVEYLMAHAYFFWPIYDEAMNKALRLLEMAIKQKALQQNLPLKGKSYAKLINEICCEPYNRSLKDNFNRAREIRNHHVHAERNSFSGAVGGKGKNIQLFVTFLNELFRDDNWQKAQFEKSQAIERQLLTFKDSLMIFENNAPGILVSGILDFKILDETLFLVLNPVLSNTKKSLEEHRYSNPISIALSNFTFQEDFLTGTSEDCHEIKIYKTAKAENVLQLENHTNGLNSVGTKNRALFEAYMKNKAAWSIVELEYNYISTKLN